MPICKVCGKKSFWTVDVATKICKSDNCKKLAKEGTSINTAELKEQKKIEKEKREKELENRTLSEKYDVLDSFKVLAFSLMIVSTGFFIYSLVQYFDAPKVARKILENAMIIQTVSYIITMFSLFCLTKIIDFLFDLDKKTNT